MLSVALGGDPTQYRPSARLTAHFDHDGERDNHGFLIEKWHLNFFDHVCGLQLFLTHRDAVEAHKKSLFTKGEVAVRALRVVRINNSCCLVEVAGWY